MRARGSSARLPAFVRYAEAWFKAELERAVLINNLAVIGKLKKGDKIRTDSPRKAPRSASGVRKPFDAAPTQLAIDAWGPLQGVARRFREEIEGNVDHRVGNVAFVANTVDSAVAEIRELQKGIRRLTDHDKNAGRTMEDNGTRRMSPDRRRSTLRQMSSRLRDLLDEASQRGRRGGVREHREDRPLVERGRQPPLHQPLAEALPLELGRVVQQDPARKRLEALARAKARTRPGNARHRPSTS